MSWLPWQHYNALTCHTVVINARIITVFLLKSTCDNFSDITIIVHLRLEVIMIY